MTLTDKIKQNWARAAGAFAAGTFTSYALRGAVDISRFQNDMWETDPAKAGIWAGGTFLAVGLTYALGPTIAKAFTKTRKKVKEMGKLGCAALVGMTAGLAGLGYINHNVKRIGAWDPIKEMRDLGDWLDSENPMRKRNAHFLSAYVFDKPEDWSSEPSTIAHLSDDFKLFTDAKFVETHLGLSTYHTRTVLRTPTGDFALMDTNMSTHPDYKTTALYKLFIPRDRTIRNIQDMMDVHEHSFAYGKLLSPAPERALIAYNGTVLLCELEGLDHRIRCSQARSIWSVRRMTFTDTRTGEHVFGGPIENVFLRNGSPYHYNNQINELCVRFHNASGVRIRTMNGEEHEETPEEIGQPWKQIR